MWYWIAEFLACGKPLDTQRRRRGRSQAGISLARVSCHFCNPIMIYVYFTATSDSNKLDLKVMKLNKVYVSIIVVS